jgi:hypothetical protein
MENSLVQTVFCDIFSETAQFYLYQVLVRTTWPSVRTVFAKILSAFERNSGIFWTIGHRSDVLPRLLDGLQRLPKQCRILKSNSLLNTDWPSVRTVLLWHPNSFIVICWTLRSVRTPSKARPEGCTGTGWFGLEFVRNLHGHILEACDQSHALKWTLFEYMKTLKKNRSSCYC